MLRCRELSRLSKAPRAKSVNFRRQTPGSVDDLLNPTYVSYRPNYLDPTHPATSTPKRNFPDFRTDAFGLKAYPFALLSPPEQIWTTPSNPPIDTWKERVERFLSANGELGPEDGRLSVEPMKLHNSKKNRVSMSLINVASKKRTSSKRHIRLKITSKLKIAMNLIVERGADTVETDGKRKLVMNEEEAEKVSDTWISPGWTYICFPTLELYRMPYHDLIPLLRKALRQIWNQSQKMESGWKARMIEAPLKNAADKEASLKSALRKTKAGSQSKYQRLPASTRQLSTGSFMSVRGKATLVEATSDGSTSSSRHRKVATSDKAAENTHTIIGDDMKSYRLSELDASEWHLLSGRPRRGSDQAAKPIVLSGVEFRRSRDQHQRSELIKETDRLRSPPVRKSPELQRMLKVERDNASTWFGRSQMSHYQQWRKNRLKRQIWRSKDSEKDLPVDQFLDFGVQSPPAYDPFADAEPRPEPSQSQDYRTTSGHSSFGLFPTSKANRGTASGLSTATEASAFAPFYSHLGLQENPDEVQSDNVTLKSKLSSREASEDPSPTFDPFPEDGIVQPQPRAKSAAASFPDFDPFPTTTQASDQPFEPHPRTTFPRRPSEAPSSPPAAFDSASQLQSEPAAKLIDTTLPDFDPFPTTADPSSESSSTMEASPPMLPWTPRRRLSGGPSLAAHRSRVDSAAKLTGIRRELYRSKPIVLSWRTGRPPAAS
ncbi:hypothetical protein FPV67DRAFT_1671316 [Lyophyllum atratum]|nr:hypothetical protein FPV67DRAFT_1671316 [Lyophyllum atratum]